MNYFMVHGCYFFGIEKKVMSSEKMNEAISFVASTANLPAVSGALNLAHVVETVKKYDDCVATQEHSPAVCAVAGIAENVAFATTTMAGEAVLTASAAAIVTGSAPALGVVGIVSGAQILTQSGNVGEAAYQAVLHASKKLSSSKVENVETPTVSSTVSLPSQQLWMGSKTTPPPNVSTLYGGALRGVLAESNFKENRNELSNYTFDICKMKFVGDSIDIDILDDDSEDDMLDVLIAEILDLYDQGHSTLKMTFTNPKMMGTEEDNFKVKMDTILEPEILYERVCGYRMVNADIILKTELFRTQNDAVEKLDFEIIKALHAEKFSRLPRYSAVFVVGPYKWSLENNKLIVSPEANIKLKCHSYEFDYSGSNEEIRKMLERRTNLILEFEKKISDEFNTRYRQQYKSLERLAKFGKALTIAQIIKSNDIKYDSRIIKIFADDQPPLPREKIVPINYLGILKKITETAAVREKIVTYFPSGGIRVKRFNDDEILTKFSLDIGRLRRDFCFDIEETRDSIKNLSEYFSDNKVLSDLIRDDIDVHRVIMEAELSRNIFDRYTGRFFDNVDQLICTYGRNIDSFIQKNIVLYVDMIKAHGNWEKATRQFAETTGHKFFNVIMDNYNLVPEIKTMGINILRLDKQAPYLRLSALAHLCEKLGEDGMNNLLHAIQCNDLGSLKTTNFRAYSLFKYLSDKVQKFIVDGLVSVV